MSEICPPPGRRGALVAVTGAASVAVDPEAGAVGLGSIPDDSDRLASAKSAASEPAASEPAAAAATEPAAAATEEANDDDEDAGGDPEPPSVFLPPAPADAPSAGEVMPAPSSKRTSLTTDRL